MSPKGVADAQGPATSGTPMTSPPKAGEFTVILNGIKTVDGAKDAKLAKGRIALQYGRRHREIFRKGRDQAALIRAGLHEVWLKYKCQAGASTCGAPKLVCS